MTTRNILLSSLLLLPMAHVIAETKKELGSKVTSISWGSVEVTDALGNVHRYKDCLVCNNCSTTWDWRKTGTEHTPGIQIADLKTPMSWLLKEPIVATDIQGNMHHYNISTCMKESFIHCVDIIILSLGMHKMLHVKEETLEFIRSLGKQYHILQTEEAVKLYNSLVDEGKKVGILIHSTC